MSLLLPRVAYRCLLGIAVALLLAACGEPDAPATPATEPEASAAAPAEPTIEKVRVSLFSWPGYGFWFIAREKNLVPGLELDIQIIEDPYESFGLMSAGQLDV